MPKYVIFAGVNGAGKTTLYQSNPKILSMKRVNVDEIVRRIGRWDNSRDVSIAGREAVNKIKEYFENRVSFNQETTLCGNSIIKNIEKAKRLGYCIELYYVGLDSAELAVERVKIRVNNGGHGIPEQDIRKRYENSFLQLEKIIRYCDRIELFDNSKSFRTIAIYKDKRWIVIDDDVPDWCKKIIFGKGDRKKC